MAFHDKHPSDKKEQRLGWKKPVAVLAMAGSAALLGSACSTENNVGATAHPSTTTSVSAESGTSATGAHMEGDTNADGKFSVDELNAMAVSDVEHISAPKLVEALGQSMDNARQATYDKLVSTNILPEGGREFITVPSGAKASYTDQQIVNQVAIDSASVYLHNTPTTGARALPLVVDPQAKNYDTLKNLADSGALPSSHDAVEAGFFVATPGGTSVRVSGSFDGTSLADYTQARDIQLTVGTGPYEQPTRAYGLFGLVSNANGTESEWRLIRLDDGSDVHLQNYISDLILKQRGQ